MRILHIFSGIDSGFGFIPVLASFRNIVWKVSQAYLRARLSDQAQKIRDFLDRSTNCEKQVYLYILAKDIHWCELVPILAFITNIFQSITLGCIACLRGRPLRPSVLYESIINKDLIVLRLYCDMYFKSPVSTERKEKWKRALELSAHSSTMRIFQFLLHCLPEEELEVSDWLRMLPHNITIPHSYESVQGKAPLEGEVISYLGDRQRIIDTILNHIPSTVVLSDSRIISHLLSLAESLYILEKNELAERILRLLPDSALGSFKDEEITIGKQKIAHFILRASTARERRLNLKKDEIVPFLHFLAKMYQESSLLEKSVDGQCPKTLALSLLNKIPFYCFCDVLPFIKNPAISTGWPRTLENLKNRYTLPFEFLIKVISHSTSVYPADITDYCEGLVVEVVRVAERFRLSCDDVFSLYKGVFEAICALNMAPYEGKNNSSSFFKFSCVPELILSTCPAYLTMFLDKHSADGITKKDVYEVIKTLAGSLCDLVSDSSLDSNRLTKENINKNFSTFVDWTIGKNPGLNRKTLFIYFHKQVQNAVKIKGQ